MTELNLAQTLIVGHLWQSVALAAVLALVLIFGRRMQGSTRYCLAGVAFLASLALPLSALVPGETLATAIMDRLGAPRAEAPVEAATPSFVEQAIEDSGAPPWAVAVGRTAIAAARPEGKPATEAFWAREAIADGAPPWAINLGAAVVDAATQPRNAPAAEPQPLFTLPEFKLPNSNLPDLTLPLAMVWLAGTLMLLVRTGRDLIAVERLVARARPAALPEKLQRRMAGVRVAVSPDAPGPMAAGLLRPCIVLPETISLASPGMAALLEHERAHIERNDMAVALAQRIVLALLWWSPALHWMSRRIDEEREVACDEAAVHCTGDAKAFARSLTLQAQNQLWARAPRLAVGAIGPRSQVGRRVRRLIDLAKGVSPAKYSGRLAFAGLALAVAVAAMVTPRFSADAQQTPQEDNQPIDLLTRDQDARADARADATLDGGEERGAAFDGDQDFAALGEEIGRLMETLGPELEAALQGMSPELQAELAALSTEMAALGAELSVSVSKEVFQPMPQIMEEVRLALEAEGIAMDDWSDFQELSEEDREEIREAMEEAREEIRQALGPEMQAEIREALEEARIEMAEHREEIRAAFDEQRAGLSIAREAMAAARAEIEAARARGDFDRLEDFHFDFDLDAEIIQKLREKNIDIDNARAIRIRSDESTPAWKLMRAAARCNEAEVRRLITEEKADVNAVFRGDGTALIAAARSGCADAARALLNAGADPNLASAGDGNPLIAAASRGHVEVARLLLNRGANVNAPSPGDGNALIAAAQHGELALAKLLVDNGADVNAYVKGDETPLMAAAEHDELAIAKLLVDKGANVNLAYNVERGWGAGIRTELRSPLNMAQRHGNDAVAAYLRSKGAVETPEPAN
jgi:ankyrin repeat protein/beta-lactamase regulating signal transducer with metallopeptidase domain